MLTKHERAVTVEMHADFVAGAAPRAAALIRERRECRAIDGRRLHDGHGSTAVNGSAASADGPHLAA